MRRILGWNEFKLFEQVYLDKDEPKGNNISEEAFKKMRLCCFDIMGKYPFFRKLLSDLVIRENKNLPYKTMATDGYHIFYNPEWTSKLKNNELRGVIAHEVLHVVFAHSERLSCSQFETESSARASPCAHSRAHFSQITSRSTRIVRGGGSYFFVQSEMVHCWIGRRWLPYGSLTRRIMSPCLMYCSPRMLTLSMS